MKALLSLGCVLAMASTPILMHGQSLQIAAPSGPFNDLVVALEETHRASGLPLYCPDDYHSFLFEWNGFDATDASLSMDYAGPKGGVLTELLFKEVPNVDGFVMKTIMEVGFVDNESVDLNRFSVWETDSNFENPQHELTLWNYVGQGQANDPPPAAMTLVPNAEGLTPLYLAFYQFNTYTGTGSTEDDPIRFRTLRARTRDGDYTTDYWFLRSSDRGIYDDGDCDDGLFLLSTGQQFNPVPEPAWIGPMAAGLLALLVWRRRKKVRM